MNYYSLGLWCLKCMPSASPCVGLKLTFYESANCGIGKIAPYKQHLVANMFSHGFKMNLAIKLQIDLLSINLLNLLTQKICRGHLLR